MAGIQRTPDLVIELPAPVAIPVILYLDLPEPK
jgi:hypothetical protein